MLLQSFLSTQQAFDTLVTVTVCLIINEFDSIGVKNNVLI